MLDHLGSFKSKPTLCKLCGGTFQKFEEKETDVAIAAKLFEVLAMDVCDTVVLMTGDTDLVPAIKTARNLYPNKEVCVGFPYWRFNGALKQVAARHFIIKKPEVYAKHQLPDPVQLPDGTSVPKPAEW